MTDTNNHPHPKQCETCGYYVPPTESMGARYCTAPERLFGKYGVKKYLLNQHEMLHVQEMGCASHTIAPAPEPDLPVVVCNICDLAVPCDHRFGKNGYPPCVQRAAKADRERMLDQLIHEYDSGDHPEISDCDTTDEWYGHGWDDCRDAFVQHMKSLRVQQEKENVS